MNKIDFIAEIRHLGWCCYQAGADQEFNIKINQDQLDSLRDGIRFQLENPKCTPEENHNNWMKMKIKQGWVFGKVKDFEKKTHPDICPYGELPEVERKKDEIDMMTHKVALNLYDEIKNRG